MLLVSTVGVPLMAHVLPSMDRPAGRRGETLQVAPVTLVMPLPAPPWFSYQAMVSSNRDAETMSRSPSPSMSATCTVRAPSALV